MMKTFLSVFMATVCCSGLTFAAQDGLPEGTADGQNQNMQGQNGITQDGINMGAYPDLQQLNEYADEVDDNVERNNVDSPSAESRRLQGTLKKQIKRVNSLKILKY